MLRVGLTGGIGSGKSEVARRLVARGAVLIDADVVARDVVAPGTSGLAAVVEAFGPQVLTDGHLDRERLGRIVFADAAARATLNGVVHPLVGQRMAELERSASGDAIVVHDVPLIAENNLAAGYDLVIVVDAPDEVRLDRLVRLRGMQPDQARARMATQAGRQDRLAIADLVIDNSGSLADLDGQVERVWAKLRRLASQAGRRRDRPCASP